jgi:hypothetical protein
MNRAGPELVPALTVNPEPPLKTVPVGAPFAMSTTRLCFVPSAAYSVDLSVPLSATHHGPVAGSVIPQPFCRSGSVCAARPGTFELRLWTVYVPGT